jgi:pimeloyl-[acyl-carrier protein] methyl ester esterase
VTVALHVETVGSGPALVLLHGWGMHSGVWGPLLPRLARRFRVHAVDLPGHGRSPPLAAFTLDAVVAALERAFARMERLTVLGWSLGALVAMRWALAAPARVERLVLVATTPRFVSADDWPHAVAPETLARFGDELNVAWKQTILRFLSLQLQGSEPGRSALALLRAHLYERGEPDRQTLVGAFETIATADLRAEVGALAQPALVVAGSRDTLAFAAAAKWLAEAIPVARFVAIAGAAHVPFLSHPDAFDAALDGFLDGR